MSNISSSHGVVAFDSKTSRPLAGQRLAKVLYKTPAGKNAGQEKKQSVCVSVPPVPEISMDTVELMRLMPHLATLLENAQDGIIKELVERGNKVILDSEISIEACIAFLDADAKGDRLTKEYIAEWFNENVSDILTVAISDKLGLPDIPTDAQTKKVSQMCNVYRDSFAMLAGGKTCFTPDKASKLLKVLDLVDTDSLAQKFMARLKKMMMPVESDELLLGL